MIVRPIRTHKITAKDKDIFKILDRYVTSFKNNSILAITSKIISICEGSIISTDYANKDKLITDNASHYLERGKSKYNVMLTITDDNLVPSAGIDESNGFGNYILRPKNPQKTANSIREYLRKRFKRKHVGVLITDSRTTPLRWGTTGMMIANSGFEALNDFIGKPDLFGRKLIMTKVGIADGLSASAVLVMGEGNEQQPLVVIENTPFVKFQERNPTSKELRDLRIAIKDDLYAPILTKADWKKKK